MEVQIEYISNCTNSDSFSDNKHNEMAACHTHFIRTAGIGDENCYFCILHPDGIWSNGSFKRMLEVANSGKRVILVPSFRVNKDTFLPAFSQTFKRIDAIDPVTSRELVKMSFEHPHPDMVASEWGGSTHTNWPSIITWDVPGEGKIIRSFHLQLLMVKPSTRQSSNERPVDCDYVSAECDMCPEQTDIYVMQDTDEFAVFEFTKASQGCEVYPGPLSVEKIVPWSKQCARNWHLKFINYPCRAHYAPMTRKWGEVEIQSERIVESILAGHRS